MDVSSISESLDGSLDGSSLDGSLYGSGGKYIWVKVNLWKNKRYWWIYFNV